MGAVGKPLPHESAVGHVTGRARYIDDLAPMAGELCVDFVGSPVARGVVRSIDLAAARAAPGVVCVLTYEDLGGRNHFGPILPEEPFLAEKELVYLGQPVVVIGAETAEAARRACSLVRIDCDQLEPVLSIDDAIAADAFIAPERQLISPGAENDERFKAAFQTAPHTLSGRFHAGGQEQFYFETQSAIALPGEGDSIRVLSSTQSTTETQEVVSEALGVGFHQVICECHRMGGAFGGKETQSTLTAVMASLVAHKTGRPARLVLRRDVDMLTTGKRHPYQTDYRVAFDAEGRLLAVEFRFFSNGGAFADLSTSVLDRTLFHADNAYHTPLMRVTGRVCRTNLPPNTAFRGFGGPQAVVLIESCLHDIAAVVGRDPVDVRRDNLYVDGDPERSVTQYGQTVRDHLLEETLDRLVESSDYRRRFAKAEAFNRQSETQLKGVALSMVKFGISFTTKFLNQANALVNLYTDGSVQVSTGGTEMGQGLNTKIRQVVADEFGLPVERVRMMATSSEKSNNTSPTAASAGTDLNGAAALDACRQIKQRMIAYAAELFGAAPEAVLIEGGRVSARGGEPAAGLDFGEFCARARRERVNLGARGFFATPELDYDPVGGRGNPFYYYTTGAAVAEVTIDRFTGELAFDRADLLMDVGRMINPGVDRGQVIGGFVQGVGWVTNEELRYDGAGRLLSTGPTTYKIPNVTDLPRELNVDFIDNPKHQKNVRQSKAVGEPPLMLGVAVWLAAKHALSCLAPGAPVELAVPATGEELLTRMTRLARSEASHAKAAGSP
ncbi:Xanthine dehydrogenase molybdenum-binding subunit [Pseudobythopirellula maris]|uniref:Xanthine dehydrogenase molybdenum-binding subunit n=1 Tax=Pseudobythopirellula maris TaxID=2527991 RepID=A0A5C5ZMH4_9BACT|nr:xanthine dehydrogenase molybdopterin binding subunit [Pseudobythopirellula maris]TWT87643.1 Xanthine dehydrogenase molybdenum-binding subunit [Pseudobythopirellula maris]